MRKLLSVAMTVLIAALIPGVAFALNTPSPMPSAAVEAASTVTQLEIAGDAMRAQKNYERAIETYRAAIRQEPRNAILYNKMGIAYLQLGNLDQAENQFQRAIKIDRKYSPALNNAGVISYMRKNYGKAVKYYKKALALSEDNASFHVNLGTAWFSQKKLERAMAEYARALQLDPDVLVVSSRSGVAAQISSPEERAKYAYLLAKMYAKQGDVERCLLCLKRAKDVGHTSLTDIYKDPEFASVRHDMRIGELIPPPVTAQ